jgi:hypothetical protein
MPSLQIFIHELAGFTSASNNFPFIQFEKTADLYEFVKKLVSTQRTHNIPGGFFIINNPQLLPDAVRKRHMYPAPDRPKNRIDYNSDSDSGSDDEYVPLMLDGCFSIKDNLHVLKPAVIENNSVESYGFKDYVNASE